MKIQNPGDVHSFPAPVVLIGCGTVENPNLITCSWFGTVCSKPPMVSVSIRKNRFSYPLVHDNFEFTANIPMVSELDQAVHCGTKSGRMVNKFEDLGITAVECAPLKSAPMIKECSLVLGCKVKHEIELGIHTMFIAEVVSIHSDKNRIRPGVKPDPTPEKQLVYLDGKYWSLKFERES